MAAAIVCLRQIYLGEKTTARVSYGGHQGASNESV